MPYANNKGADQPAHPRSLISTFIVRCLDSIIPLISISEISSLYLASVAGQAGLSLTWLQTPKTGFLMRRLILYTQSLVSIILPTITGTVMIPSFQRKVWANSVDTDHTVADQVRVPIAPPVKPPSASPPIHCLKFSLHFWRYCSIVNPHCSNLR